MCCGRKEREAITGSDLSSQMGFKPVLAGDTTDLFIFLSCSTLDCFQSRVELTFTSLELCKKL
jgi:hypothetical protein